MKKTIFCIIILFLALICRAQFNPIQDTTVCQNFILPLPIGINLSNNIAYYNEKGGGGIKYLPGQLITKSMTVFVYDKVKKYEACFFVRVVPYEPEFFHKENVVACDYYFLPKFEGKNLTSEASYSTQPKGNGLRYYPGQVITESITIYLYDGIDGCFDQDSFHIKIVLSPSIVNYPDSILICDNYIFPPIKGVMLPLNCSYKSLKSGYAYYPNDEINKEDLIEVVCDTSACVVRDTFRLFKGSVYLEDIRDTFVCGQFIVRYKNYKSSGYSMRHTVKTGSTLSTSSSIFQSSEVCIYEGVDSTDCEIKKCFYVKVGNTKSGFLQPTDTVRFCKVEQDVSIDFFLKRYNLFPPYDFYSEPSGFTVVNNKINFSNLSSDVYTLKFISRPESNCDYKGDTTIIIVKIVDDCLPKNYDGALTVEGFTCQDITTNDLLYNEIIYPGGVIYNFNNVAFPLNAKLPRSNTNELTYKCIYKKSNGVNDIILIKIPPVQYEDIKVTSIEGSTDLCYGDCFKIYFDISDTLAMMETRKMPIYYNDGSNKLYKNSDTYTINFTQREVWVCFEKEEWYTPTSINLANTSFYIIFTRNSIFFDSSNPCIKDLKPDTVYFRTFSNSSSQLQQTMCPGEILIIGQDTFDVKKPKGKGRIKSSNGCDSIVFVNLVYKKPTFSVFKRIFCDTASYVNFGCERYDFHRQKDTILFANAASTGCDSIVYIDLQFQYFKDVIVNRFVPFGIKYVYKNKPYGYGQVFQDTVISVIGCDSLNRTNRILFLPYPDAIDTILCNGANFKFNAKTYGKGIHLDTIKSSFGFDSVYYKINVKIWPKDSLLLTGETIKCKDQATELSVGNALYGLYLNGVKIEKQFFLLAEGLYNLVGIDSNGCKISKDFTIKDKVIPYVDAINLDNIVFTQAVPLPVTYNGQIIQYTWTPTIGLDCYNCSYPNLISKENKLYHIEVVNAEGCKAKDSLFISTVAAKLYLPNTLSRNADNNNFYAKSLSNVSYSLYIYNRWGNLVFYNDLLVSNEAVNSWKPSPDMASDVYVYKLVYKEDDEVKVIYGNITLL
jgi:hypothetical protein